MSDRRLAIISTRLPPLACGIGSYSWRLREHWPNESKPVQFFLMENGVPADADRAEEFAGAAARLSRGLERFGSGDLLLHYAGRAYQRFGCPLWLPGVLAKWKRRFPDSRLVVFFHEVAGEAPFASRQFWLGLLDHHIARRLVALADGVATNTESHAAILRGLTNSRTVQVLPVGSNIESAPISGPRAPGEFVVFGLPFGRMQTLQWFDAHIRAWMQSGRLTRLHLIGPTDAKFSSDAERSIARWPNPAVVVRHGLLPSDEVARLLRQAQFCLTNVRAETWSKSGAFMACAINETPVVIRDSRERSGPLAFAVGAEEVATISDEELARRTAALADWYRENADWPVIAQRVSALFPSS